MISSWYQSSRFSSWGLFWIDLGVTSVRSLLTFCLLFLTNEIVVNFISQKTTPNFYKFLNKRIVDKEKMRAIISTLTIKDSQKRKLVPS